VIDLPIEEIIIAGPDVDLGLANLTPEIAGMLVEMLLPGRAVGQPAIGTVEIFYGPKVVARHAAIMQRNEHGVPVQLSATLNALLLEPVKARQTLDSDFLTR
jgi:hypothetical protein